MGSEDLREMGDAWGEEGVGGRGRRVASAGPLLRLGVGLESDSVSKTISHR